MSRLVDLILDLIRRLLPPSLRPWGEAAIREARSATRPGEALPFALGCLSWAVRESIRFRLSELNPQRETPVNLIDRIGPRPVAVACGVGATGLGLIYMSAGGAPAHYLMINSGALVFGLVALAILAMADRRGHLPAGPLTLAFGLALLAVSLWGVTAGGVTRWLALGPLVIQPGFMIVPLMAVLFARSRDAVSLAGVAAAALALALQPDRGLAAAFAAGLAVLAFTRPDRLTIAAAVTAALGFGAALAQPDPSPAMPFVDQILYSAFTVHPLAGAAVVLGAVLLVLPALAARRLSGPAQTACIAFGAVWAALILAAALGNYPTPLVGYGGSAIVGYLLSLVVFPRRAPGRVPAPVEAASGPESDGPLLFAGRP
jgi:cell division protein FtsW (lipid II flippase)